MPGRGEIGHRRGQVVPVTVDKQHRGATFRQCFGDALADALRRTRHDDDPIAEGRCAHPRPR